MNRTDQNNPSVKSSEKVRNKKPGIRWLLVAYDVLIFVASAALFLFLFPGTDAGVPLLSRFYHALIALAYTVVGRFGLRVYVQIWRYGGIQSYLRLTLADIFALAAYYVTQAILGMTGAVERVIFVRCLSMIAVSLLGALIMRMLYRYAYKCGRSSTRLRKFLFRLACFFSFRNFKEDVGADASHKIKIAIIGAGHIGVSLAEELMNDAQMPYTPRCFIDSDPDKCGRQLFGIPVLSEGEATGSELREYGVQEIVFAITGMTQERTKEIYDYYQQFGYKIKVYDVSLKQTGSEGHRQLREFDIEELLFRKPIELLNDKTRAYYRDKVVMITGGGGSIGSELCRQIAKMSPRKLVILDVYENGAYDIQQELRIAYGKSVDVQVEIVSVCNRPALARVFEAHRPQVVLNAAAHKHVPLMEHNCVEAVENNVFGTLNTVELSEQYGVERVIMVSTDKAVNPTNVMGATKRMCEMIVQSHSQLGTGTTFSITRFGNVLGSAGSVIPLFRRQIAVGGPVTVTDKRIIRYFMTIPEASQLVLESGAMAKNGELFVLDMGKPVRILDLAENMIRLSGLEPYRDIKIIETGLRPGEKLYEELLVRTEELNKTENSLIFVERDNPLTAEEIEEKLRVLRDAVETGRDDAAREALRGAVPTFRRPEEVNVNAKDVTKAEMRGEVATV